MIRTLIASKKSRGTAAKTAQILIDENKEKYMQHIGTLYTKHAIHKPMMTIPRLIRFLGLCLLVAGLPTALPAKTIVVDRHPAGVSNTQAQTLPNINLGGYNGMYVERVDSSYNAGISQYVSMLGRPQYAGYNSNSAASFQAGTWLTAQDTTANVYSTIEGGPGQGGAYGNFWNNNGFGMGVVGPKFRGVANGPIGGWGDGGQYAVAQLSPRLLFPPRSEMFRAGTAGQFAGYGYFALPLLPGKPTTDGVNVPTGDRWWTLFFNTRNFKGPVAAVVPYFWSKFTKDRPEWAGQLLDSRWTDPNPQYSNESHTVPGKEYDGPEGSYVRVQPLFFSLNNGANSTIALNSPTAYNQTALWNAANQWFNNNGPAPVGPFTSGAIKKKISGGKLGWTLWESPVRPNPKPRNMPMNFDFVTPTTPDQFTMGYQWGTNEVVELTQYADGTPAVKMPEYYQLVKGVWTPVPRRSLPPSVAAKLDSEKLEDTPPVIKAPEVWTRSDEPSDTPHWTIPGPATGPFQARLDNGMVVTYHWYRFRDQPALQYADLTEAELTKLQTVAEKIHQAWTIDGSYLAEPTMGTLADVDPALLVTPPPGMEVGYVPIPNRQEWGGFVNFTWKRATSGNFGAAASWNSGAALVDGGHSYYRLNFSPSGTYTVTNDLNSGYGHGGYKVNRLSFAGAVTLTGNPITLTADYEALPQINQNSSNPVVISAPLKMYVSTVLGGTGNGTVDITSDIFGPWQGLTIKSPGTWRLSGNNTYTGTTSVETGTLSCSQPASLGSGALKISNGAVLNLNYRGTRTISSLTLGGTVMPAGVYGSSSSPATYKDSRFSGNGTVTVPVLVTGPQGAGTISRDVWTNVTGTSVSAIPLATSPNISDTLTSFEGPSNWANNYGTRIRGYLTAPDTGSYTFWIASDKNSKLWLSTDSAPTNKVKIAEVSSYTGSREWNKFSSQKSVTINLIAGKQYYIEALHKEGSGNDHLAVGWSKPGESASSPSEVIPGAQLSPYVPSSLPVNSTLNPADNTTDVAVATNLAATFSENIAIGTGNITLKNRYAWCPQEIKLLGR